MLSMCFTTQHVAIAEEISEEKIYCEIDENADFAEVSNEHNGFSASTVAKAIEHATANNIPFITQWCNGVIRKRYCCIF